MHTTCTFKSPSIKESLSLLNITGSRIQKMSRYNHNASLPIALIAILSLLLAQNVYGQGYHSVDLFGENHALKIHCSGGSVVDFVSDCPVNDKCSSLRISGNDTLQCIPSVPVNTLNQ